MKLTIEGLRDRADWEAKGFILPAFDIQAMRALTREEPTWLHFGAGNIFRAFPAAILQKLLNAGQTNTGVIVCEAFDEEILAKSFWPYDNLCIAATLKKDAVEKEVVASIAESIAASENPERLREIFCAPSLQLASFTITEKGYAVKDAAGRMLPYIAADAQGAPENAKSIIGLITYLCYVRYQAGSLPLTLVSMDNCAENGVKLFGAVETMARCWIANRSVPEGFLTYLTETLRFPCSMIDKITPSPAEDIRKQLEALGCEDMHITRTARNTVAAPFVNAEETQYLVIEDAFSAGKPPLDKAGVLFVDRETVDNIEKMKVGACLNPLHTILAVFGMLLDYRFIYEEMRDKALVNMIKQAGMVEALPFVPHPGVMDPEDFVRKVIEVRLPNPYIPDTPNRIAADTSQKVPVRFGGTVREMTKRGFDVSSLTAFPLFFAGWLRYLLCVNDAGAPFTPSPDPMLDELRTKLARVEVGKKENYGEILAPILSNAEIFGVNLHDSGLAAKTEAYFARMIEGPGAVRKLLDETFG